MHTRIGAQPELSVEFLMVLEPGRLQTLSFRGEVVEIFERNGVRFARITIGTRDMLDIKAEGLHETHLGDHVVIEANITVENIKPE
jgi:hypothetical protein